MSLFTDRAVALSRRSRSSPWAPSGQCAPGRILSHRYVRRVTPQDNTHRRLSAPANGACTPAVRHIYPSHKVHRWVTDDLHMTPKHPHRRKRQLERFGKVVASLVAAALCVLANEYVVMPRYGPCDLVHEATCTQHHASLTLGAADADVKDGLLALSALVTIDKERPHGPGN